MRGGRGAVLIPAPAAAIAIAAACLVALAACGDSGTETSTSAATTSAVPSTEVAETTAPPDTEAPSTTGATGDELPAAVLGYFTAFAKDGPPRAEMFDFASSGSAAEAYAVYWAGLSEAAPEGGFTQEVVVGEGDLEVCLEGACIYYDDFVVDDDGLLVDFDEFDGAMSGKVALGDGTTVAGSEVGIEMVVVKNDVTIGITMLWQITNTSSNSIDSEIRLLDAGGNTLAPTQFTGQSVAAGATILDAASFATESFDWNLQVRIVESGEIVDVPLPRP